MSAENEDPLAIKGKIVLYRDSNRVEHYAIVAGYRRKGVGVGRTKEGKLVKRKTAPAAILRRFICVGEAKYNIKPLDKKFAVLFDDIVAVRWFNKDIPMAEWLNKHGRKGL